MLKTLTSEEISKALFRDFHRRQQVTKCWRKVDGRWAVIDNPFIDDWTPQEYDCLVDCLKTTLAEGGAVFGIFEGSVLKAFASVEAAPFGSHGQYRELTCIHVSEEMRGQGLGRRLMDAAKQWAKAHGGEKLYISAHSAVESQAFYMAIGCREAEEYNPVAVEKEPCDCQLELPL